MRLGPLVVLVLLAPFAQPAPAVEPWWATTLLDADRDGLDDALVLVPGATVTVLVDYARMPDALDQAALARAGFEVTFSPRHFPLLAARGPAERVASLLDLPGVVLVEANDVLTPQLKESVPLIGAPLAWRQYGATGRSVTIAVLDDGAFEQHPDFEGRIAGRFDASAPESPVDAPVTIVAPAGEEGHATHVAGIALGPGTESGGAYRGVAPDARLVNVKVFTAPNQTTSDLVLRGLDWVLANRERLDIRVAVMSLGGRVSDGKDALSRGVDVAVDEGLVVVAAAGNTGPSAKTVTSPGAAEKAITVGAVDKQKRVASFSARGPTLDGRLKPEIAAPGVAITSTVPPVSTGGLRSAIDGAGSTYYGTLSGTSMAAPHVAGVAALMLQANPRLSPFDVKRILVATAQDVAKPGADNDTGYGFVNAAAAVQVARDPAMLNDPRFADRLATLPEPAPESLLDRLSFEAQSAQRSGILVPTALALLAVIALVVIGLVAARRR